MTDRSIFAVIVSEFGALAAAWLLAPIVAPSTALGATVLFVTFGAWRHRGLGFSRPWLIVNGLALLLATMHATIYGHPIACYEGSFGNGLSALAFMIGAFGQRSLAQEFAEARRGGPFDSGRPGLASFFRVYTVAWGVFFLTRAVIWVWATNRHLDLSALRIAMPVSLIVMLALSFKGPWLFRVACRWGLGRSSVGVTF